MTAKIIKMPVAIQLECPKCGIEAGCNCGVAPVPKGTRAEEKIKAKPEMSNRAIAAELGVSLDVVNEARKRVGERYRSPERVGRDGKSYPAKPRKVNLSDPIEEECEDCDTDEQRWQTSLSNLAGDAISLRAYWTREFGKWQKFEVTPELVKLANQAAEAWHRIASDLEDRK